ncbi:nucleoside transporter-like protein family [Calycina marina]|uniref:Nucleoside transporter-like protein family n=1 Tax=Calycina marina TaxID=1763456 RepID=A0A9P7Z0W8_9HELO|nr:nucleoside transporter-like protein family [Calycina marina]
MATPNPVLKPPVHAPYTDAVVTQEPAYQQVDGAYSDSGDEEGDDGGEGIGLISCASPVKHHQEPYCLIEYATFLLLGVAMLWAWNMFLAAAPYFQTRFSDNDRILASFQSAITSVSSATNLLSMITLMHMQSKASYPKRILASLALNLAIFALLAISTTYFRGVLAETYFAFTLLMVLGSSVAAGLCQNGAYAFAASFGRPEYLQAIMIGQAIAGVLPSIAQIVSVLAVPELDKYVDSGVAVLAAANENTTSALIYFTTATVVSALCLVAIIPLIRKHSQLVEDRDANTTISSEEEVERSKRKVVSIWTLYKKLHWLAAAVFLCFVITMFFPVFTQKIVSVIPEDEGPQALKPGSFIPLGFLLWNVGDLLGRLSTFVAYPDGASYRRPIMLFLFAALRSGFVPLYLLCNIENHGAIINSDFFYLGVQQLFFGISNGWLGSYCMMDFSQYVDEGEREAAGGFMALNLVAGLTVGSLLSFSAAGVH